MVENVKSKNIWVNKTIPSPNSRSNSVESECTPHGSVQNLQWRYEVGMHICSGTVVIQNKGNYAHAHVSRSDIESMTKLSQVQKEMKNFTFDSLTLFHYPGLQLEYLKFYNRSRWFHNYKKYSSNLPDS